MSAVKKDYGLDDSPSPPLIEGDPRNKGTIRRVWELVQVSADPTKPDNFYAVQKLTGEWVRSPEIELYQVVWQPRASHFPPVTRLIYGTLDEAGQIINLSSPQKRAAANPLSAFITDGGDK